MDDFHSLPFTVHGLPFTVYDLNDFNDLNGFDDPSLLLTNT
jgi:hypothetical protein